MEIGFLTWYIKNTPLEEIFAWAAKNKFSGIELNDCPKDVKQIKALIQQYPEVTTEIPDQAKVVFGLEVLQACIAAVVTV